MGCGRCHEHKYDPISQQEFYGLFAFFNNIPESGRAVKEGNSPPYIKTPTRIQSDQLEALDQKLSKARRRMQRLGSEIASSQSRWERSSAIQQQADWTYTRDLKARFPLDGLPTGASKADFEFKDGEPTFEAGKSGRAAAFDGRRFVSAGDVGAFGYFDKFSLAAWIKPEPKGGTILSKMTDEHRSDGYYIRLVDGKIEINLVKRWLDDSIRVESAKPIEPNLWQHILVVYDGSRLAKGIRLYINGAPVKLKVNLDGINQTFASKEPLRIGGGGGPQGRFFGLIDDVRIYDNALTAEQAGWIATIESVPEIAGIPADKRTRRQAGKLRACFLERGASKSIQSAHHRLLDLQKRRQRLFESFPTTMVMQEMPVPRETRLLLRGEYDKPGEKIDAGVPSIFPSLPKAAPMNRLGLARWLVDESNPLTARVTVNRYWQGYFGVGLVKTTEDFGSQGEQPTHPLLLDWLASEFMRTGWNVKALQRLIVTSSTYRQSAKASGELIDKDPENRLFSRGPRFRLSAQAVRDQALYAADLLVERVGGPSVRPYQPADLWKEIASDGAYNQDHGGNLYRRSMYTYAKRTVAPPTMAVFDASDRETCIVRKVRTNTPLQALTLMNEVTFVESARVLAQRMLESRSLSTVDGRIDRVFRLITSRRPKPAEREIVRTALERYLTAYRSDRQAAEKLCKVGEYHPNPKLDVAEHAAWTALASMLFNLDETVTKE